MTVDPHRTDPPAEGRAQVGPREFQEAGYLLEVNRQFLHPLGLALFIGPCDPDDRDGEWGYGVLDARADLEGYMFAELDDADRAKASRVAHDAEQRAAVRLAKLGYVVQPFSDEVVGS